MSAIFAAASLARVSPWTKTSTVQVPAETPTASVPLRRDRGRGEPVNAQGYGPTTRNVHPEPSETFTEPKPYEHFRSARIRMATRCIYAYLLAGATAIVLLSESDTGSFPLPVAVVCAGFLGAAIIWGERVTIKTGLEESPAGFIDHRNFGSRRLTFEDIERFDHRKTLSVDRVYAVRRDGKGVPIQGLVQGRRMIWDGGETNDIVGVLNDRLHDRHAARAIPR